MDIGRSWTQRRADGMIALISMAWGSSYLMMKVGLDGLGPFCLTALRFSLAFAAVALLFLPQLRRTTWRTLGHAAALGLLLFGVFAFLLHGMETTTASNAGFLTSTTVVLVPLLNALLRRRPPEGPIALGAVLALGGIGLLSFQSGTGFHSGDLLCLGGALCYACHILLTDRLTRRDDALLLGVWQLGFAALYGALALLLFEPPTHPTDPAQWAAVLGLATGSSPEGIYAELARQVAAGELDLSGVTFFGSAGVTALVWLSQHPETAGKHVRVVATSRVVTGPLELTIEVGVGSITIEED